MKGSIKSVGLLLVLLAGTAHAEDAVQEIALPQDAPIFQASNLQAGNFESRDAKFYMLAQNDAGTSNATRNVASTTPGKPADEFKESMFTLNKTHKFLGVSTIAAALATMVTAPGEGCERNCPPPSQQPPRDRTGTHAKLARVTVGLAAATIATGILTHWDDIDLKAGITDPDNLHALLGITGALLMAQAVNKSAGSTVPVSHAGQAELGAALMAVGIKMVW